MGGAVRASRRRPGAVERHEGLGRPQNARPSPWHRENRSPSCMEADVADAGGEFLAPPPGRRYADQGRPGERCRRRACAFHPEACWNQRVRRIDREAGIQRVPREDQPSDAGSRAPCAAVHRSRRRDPAPSWRTPRRTARRRSARGTASPPPRVKGGSMDSAAAGRRNNARFAQRGEVHTTPYSSPPPTSKSTAAVGGPPTNSKRPSAAGVHARSAR